MYQEATAPGSIGTVLDKGFQLFRASFSATWGLAFAAALAAAPLGQTFGALGTATPGPGLAGAAVLFWIIYMIIICIVYSTMLIRIGGVASGEPVELSTALKRGVGRSGAFLGASIAYGVVVMLGFMLLLIPGLYFAVAYVLASFAVVLEDRGPIQSLGDSFRLVKGNWWRTATILTVAAFIYLVLYFLVGMIAGFAVATNPEALIEAGGFPWYIDYIVMPLLSSVLLPLSYCLLYSVYRDLKLRHEGSDLAARMAATSQ